MQILHNYSYRQIAFGLRIGLGDNGFRDVAFTEKTSLVEFFNRNAGYAFDVELSLIWAIEETFGFYCSMQEWKVFFSVAENGLVFAKTFNDLFEFIVSHTEAVSFEPITVFGKPCVPAGLFCGIENIASQINEKCKPFAPSTPIRQRLRGRSLDVFWNRLQWISVGQLPELQKESWVSKILYTFLCLLIAVTVCPLIVLFAISILELVSTGITFAAILTCITLASTLFVLLMPGISSWVIYQFRCPLPDGIVTFRDLSLALIKENLNQQK